MTYLWQTHLSDSGRSYEPNYYQKPRAEILPFITWMPAKVLDIGCGGGATGSLLMQMFSGCQLYGIERDHAAAEHAASVYHQVLTGNIEALDLNAVDLPFAEIDTVLLLDVLEHFYNPWLVLDKLRKVLPVHCRLIASIPNAFNIQLLDELAAGSWHYTADGLLDITHVRFFCEADIRLLFTETGYSVLAVGNVPHPISRLPEQIYRQADHVETPHVVVKNLDAKSIVDLFTIQKVLVASINPDIEYQVSDTVFDIGGMVEDVASPLQRLRNSYLDMVRGCVLGLIYEDPALVPKTSAVTPFDLGRRENGLDWPSLAHSMIGQNRLLNAQQLAEYVITRNIPGDLIETGVWRGGTCILLRAVLKAYDVHDRSVWVADSFEGLPKPSPELYPDDAGDTHYECSDLAVSLVHVQDNFKKYGLLDGQVQFLKGWFRDTLPQAPIGKLALLRLDGDMYESTMDALVNLFPKLSPGGFVIVDDYGYIDSCRKAVEDYRAKHGIKDPIHEIDQFGIYWQNCLPNDFSIDENEDNKFDRFVDTAYFATIPKPKAGVESVLTSEMVGYVGRALDEGDEVWCDADANTLASEHVQLVNRGYCHCCRTEVSFTIRGPWLRDQYLCDNCGSIPRFRHLLYVLDSHFPGWEMRCTHEVDPCHGHIAKWSQNYNYSQLLFGNNSGKLIEGVPCEDIENLSFPDNSFDLLITQDIIKLLFHPDRAMREIMRVLKPGGAHVFTVPRNLELVSSRPRVLQTEDQVIEHLLEPEYHGSPVETKYLVKWDYGQDLEALIWMWCGQSTVTYLTHNRMLGLDGEYLDVFVTRKAF